VLVVLQLHWVSCVSPSLLIHPTFHLTNRDIINDFVWDHSANLQVFLPIEVIWGGIFFNLNPKDKANTYNSTSRVWG